MPPRRDVASLESLVDRTRAALATGLTPPAEWYHDPELYALEQERIFARTWQLVALTPDVEEPGAYTTVVAGEREFLLVRDLDGRLRAFHNVCLHRAGRVVEGAGQGRLLQCRYHGWTYRLDGTLNRAPGMDRAPGFDAADCRLREVAVAVWPPFVFLNPDPDAQPLDAFLGSVPARVADLGMDLTGVAGEQSFLVHERTLACNWKLAVENSLECYHCPTVHPTLAATVDLSRRDFVVLRSAVVGRTPLRAEAGTNGPTAPTRGMAVAIWDAATRGDGLDFHQFHWLFPNQSLSIWPGPGNSFTLNRWRPIAPDRTHWWLGRWWPATVAPDVRAAQWEFVLQVAGQDVAILEGVQRGVQSGAWSHGRYQLIERHRSERPLQAFNAMVAGCLSAPDGVDWSRPQGWEST
jgi:choline monooxygenase